MKTILFLCGGCPTQKRAEKLLWKWIANGKEGVFVVTGYPKKDAGELDSMVQYLLDNDVPKSQIIVDSSYETFSNVESLEKFLINNEIELNECEIFTSTGPWHWFRFKLIFLWEFLYGERFNFFDIEFLPSGEKEVWYAQIAIVPYILFTPKGWQRITRLLRKKEYELCKNSNNIRAIAQKYGVKLINE